MQKHTTSGGAGCAQACRDRSDIGLLASVSDLPRQGLLLLVRGYRLLLKPWLGNGCRFEPTCSQYALTALERHGACAGAALAAGRLLRCHPWCQGGCDDVPATLPRWFTRLVDPLAPHPALESAPPAVQTPPSAPPLSSSTATPPGNPTP